jgi:hypothetical protein
MDADFVRDTLGMLRRFPTPAVQGVASLIRNLAGDRSEEFCLWLIDRYDEWGGPKWLREVYEDFAANAKRRELPQGPAAPLPAVCPRCDNLGYVLSQRENVVDVKACSCPLGAIMTPEGLQIEREVRNRPRAPEVKLRPAIPIDMNRLRAADWQEEKAERERRAEYERKKAAEQREAEIEELRQQEAEALRVLRAKREASEAAKKLKELEGDPGEKPADDVCAA